MTQITPKEKSYLEQKVMKQIYQNALFRYTLVALSLFFCLTLSLILYGFRSYSDMTGEGGIYECAASYINPTKYDSSRYCPPAIAQIITSSTGDDYQTVLYEEGSLTNDSQRFTATIDSGTRATFEVTSDELLTFTLVSPIGATIDPAMASTDPNITYQHSTLGEVQIYRYEIAHLALGEWQNQLQVDGVASYLLLNQTNSPLVLNYRTDKFTYQPDELVTLQVAIRDRATLLTGVTFTGLLTNPDQSTAPLVFYDDGAHGDGLADDGLYATQFTAITANGYATMQITGVKEEITRFAETRLTIAATTAYIQPITTTLAVDTNGNTLYDHLTFELPVEVLAETQFLVQAALVAADGQFVATTSTAPTLAVGLHTLPLQFDGRTIAQSGLDGPYTLSSVTINDLSQRGLVVETAESLAVTSPYTARAFERPLITLVAIGDTPIDDDGNGRFDTLTFDLTADVVMTGTYHFSGRLMDKNGREIGWSSGSFEASNEGVHIMPLSFDGRDIEKHGVDGPYILQDLDIFHDEVITTTLFEPPYTTPPYQLTDFEVR